MSFQINTQFADDVAIRAMPYLLMGMAFIGSQSGRLRRNLLLLIIAATIVGATLGSPLQGLGAGLSAAFGYYCNETKSAYLHKALRIFFWANFAVIAAQFLGLNDAVYSFVNYSNDAKHISVFEEGFGSPVYLPQMRPSGLFPAPTYISLYAILFFVQIYNLERIRWSLAMAAGVFYAIIGSTLGNVLMAFAGLLAIGNRAMRRMLLFYVGAMIVYWWFLPAQFLYNYVLDSLTQSVESRTDLANTGGESIIQNNPLAFAGIGAVALIAALINYRYIKRGGFDDILIFAIAVSLPVLVHNVSGSVLYWFLIGVSFPAPKQLSVSTI